MFRQGISQKKKASSKVGLWGRKLSIPRYLRAVEVIPYVKDGIRREKQVQHFVEWHSGAPDLLLEPTSHTQLCIYFDLGKVGDCTNVSFVEAYLYGEVYHREVTYVVSRDASPEMQSILRLFVRSMAIFSH